MTPIQFISFVLPRLGLTIGDITGSSRDTETSYARLLYGNLLFCFGVSITGVSRLINKNPSSVFYYPERFEKELQWNKSFQEFVTGVDMIYRQECGGC